MRTLERNLAQSPCTLITIASTPQKAWAFTHPVKAIGHLHNVLSRRHHIRIFFCCNCLLCNLFASTYVRITRARYILRMRGSEDYADGNASAISCMLFKWPRCVGVQHQGIVLLSAVSLLTPPHATSYVSLAFGCIWLETHCKVWLPHRDHVRKHTMSLCPCSSGHSTRIGTCVVLLSGIQR